MRSLCELDDDDDTVDMFACLLSKTAHRMLFRQLRLLKKISKSGYMQDNPMKNTSYQ